MSIDSQEKRATQNFQKHLAENAYPGRGIVIGRNPDESWLVIYWIMGRSANSRNRIFTHENGVLRTEVADVSLLEDPSLIIYNAIRDNEKGLIVTNGSHTDTVHEGLEQGKSFCASLENSRHEPDAPNYTARIAGYLDQTESSVTLAIIRRSDFSAENSVHYFYRYSMIAPGYGYGVTTYLEDGNPLPSFSGEPILLPLAGDAGQIADIYWQGLNPENRISLAVRELRSSGEDKLRIINRY